MWMCAQRNLAQQGPQAAALERNSTWIIKKSTMWPAATHVVCHVVIIPMLARHSCETLLFRQECPGEPCSGLLLCSSGSSSSGSSSSSSNLPGCSRRQKGSYLKLLNLKTPGAFCAHLYLGAVRQDDRMAWRRMSHANCSVASLCRWSRLG
jgi:hypothetical protein